MIGQIFSPNLCVIAGARQWHVLVLLHRLHWLRAPQRISFKLAVPAFRCLRGLAPTYLSDSLRHVADLPGRQRLRFASSADLAVPQTRLQTVGDRAFCVAAANIWNGLPSEVTSSVTLSTFKQKLKTYLFQCHFPACNISPYWRTVTAMLLHFSLKIMIDWLIDWLHACCDVIT